MVTTMRLGHSSGSTHGSTHEILTGAPSAPFIDICGGYGGGGGDTAGGGYWYGGGGGGDTAGAQDDVGGGGYGGGGGGDTAGDTAAFAIVACRTA